MPDQTIRWLRFAALFFFAAIVGCLYFCWVITHDLSDLKVQVADLQRLVVVDQDARIRQTEIVINDLESSLMPGIAVVQDELRNIGKEMQDVKTLLKNKDSDAPHFSTSHLVS